MKYAHLDECKGDYHGNSSEEDGHTPMMTWNVAQCVHPTRRVYISCDVGDLDKPDHVWEWSFVSQLWLVIWTPVCSQLLLLTTRGQSTTCCKCPPNDHSPIHDAQADNFFVAKLMT